MGRMVIYLALKTLHISCAVSSYTLFWLRGFLRLRGKEIPAWLGITPHFVDTILLSSAIALTYLTGQYPFINNWLTAKFCALLLYIILGMIALKYAQHTHTRLLYWLAAQAVFAYIVLTAVQHHPVFF